MNIAVVGSMSRGSNTLQARRTRCPLSRTISGGMQVFLICRAAEASHACRSSRRDRKDRTTKTYCRLPRMVQQPQPSSHCGSHILGGQGTGQVRRVLLLLSDPTKNVVSTLIGAWSRHVNDSIKGSTHIAREHHCPKASMASVQRRCPCIGVSLYALLAGDTT